MPLDSLGRQQAAAAATRLAAMAPDRIVSSDLIRALDTAAVLGSLTGLRVSADPDLRETFAGDWQGMTRAQLQRQAGAELAAWAAGSDLRPGGGERRSEVAARVVGSVHRALAEVRPGGVLVVVTHGGAARAALGQLLGLPVANWGVLGVLGNCAWSVLAETGGAGPAASIAEITVTAESPGGFEVPPTPPWRLIEYNAQSLPVEPVGDDRIGTEPG